MDTVNSQETLLRSDLLAGKLSVDEYFCYVLSIYGDVIFRRDFPVVVGKVKLTDQSLGNELHYIYEQYFTVSAKEHATSLQTSENTPSPDDTELELAIALSLGEDRLTVGDTVNTHASGPSFVSYADKLRPGQYGSSNVRQHQNSPSATNDCSSLLLVKDTEQESTDRTKNINTVGTRTVGNDLSENERKRPNRRRRPKRNTINSNIERPLMSKPVIVLYRRDLRTYDNPALRSAIERNAPVIPVFIWSKTEEAPNLAVGGATSYWLHQSLSTLNRNLQHKYGSRVIFRKATSTIQELCRLIKDTDARTVCMNAVYEPWLAERDGEIEKRLKGNGVEVICHHSYLLHEPNSINVESTGLRGIGSVTHFMECSKRSSMKPLCEPLDAPTGIPLPGSWPTTVSLDELELARMPRRKDGTMIDWAANIRRSWKFGEDGGYEALQQFLGNGVYRYEKESGRADERNTCRISPYLHWGEISPRTILAESYRSKSPKFRRKLAWRDMSYWLLTLFPEMPWKPMRPHYQFQRWSENKADLKAWQKGNTGYPLVDAAMRELWLTGWMNNYMRHVVASFLISYLHIHWIEGYNWFQDTLVDADVAINAMMWQNGGMSGLDQWNFVMHPVDAAMTCDPRGDYVRQWIPALSSLPDEYINTPWKCPASQLRRAGVHLGQNYPVRIVTDLEAAREKSLQDVVAIRKMCETEFVDSKTGNDLVPIPLVRFGNSAEQQELCSPSLATSPTLLLPVITRREFKYKTANPDATGNPHSAVLKGYRSRKRDEAIAYANQKQFLASTMNEYVQRQERLLKLADL